MTSTPFNISPTLIPTKKLSSKPSSSPPSSVAFRRRLLVNATCTSTAQRPSSHITSPASLYEVLGIQIGATCLEIKAAYRKLARILHPDVATEKEDSSSEFMKVHEAYETLYDPEKRADYDRSLFWRSRSMGSPFMMPAQESASVYSSGASGFTSRRWETDQCW